MKLILLCILALLGGNPVKYTTTKQQAKSIATLTDLGDGKIFKMDYKADYLLQELIDSDLNSQAAVKGFAATKLLNVPTKPKTSPANPACSAFQAVTPDGDVIYGRNFDYRFKDGATIMTRISPKKGYRSLSMVSMNFVGYEGKQLTDGKTDLSMLAAAPLMQMDGMNEKGLAVSVLVVVADDYARQTDPTKHSVMTSVMMRALLDRAATVDEALKIVNSYNFFADGFQKDRKPGNYSNYHFLLSDRTGHTVILEYIKKDGPDSDSQWIANPVEEKFATNYFRSEGWQNVGRQDNRYPHLKEVLTAKNGVLTEAEAMKLLDEVHQTASEHHEGKTQWSVVYNLTKGTAKVCVNHDYSKVYEFSLKKFNKK